MWAYLQTNVQTRTLPHGDYEVSHGGYRHLWSASNFNKASKSEYQTRLLLNDYVTSDHSVDRVIPTVAWCAKQLHLSANYFGDLIKQRTGRSAQEYIQHRIINEAKMLLNSGRYTISEIAYRLGFKYPHHLTRMFHRIEGCTPNQYRLRIVK